MLEEKGEEARELGQTMIPTSKDIVNYSKLMR